MEKYSKVIVEKEMDGSGSMKPSRCHIDNFTTFDLMSDLSGFQAQVLNSKFCFLVGWIQYEYHDVDVCFLSVTDSYYATKIFQSSLEVDNPRFMKALLCHYNEKLRTFLVGFKKFRDLRVCFQELGDEFGPDDDAISKILRKPKPPLGRLRDSLQTEIKGLAKGLEAMHNKSLSSTWLDSYLGYVWCVETQQFKILLVDVDIPNGPETHLSQFKQGLQRYFLQNATISDWQARGLFLSCITDRNINAFELFWGKYKHLSNCNKTTDFKARFTIGGHRNSGRWGRKFNDVFNSSRTTRPYQTDDMEDLLRFLRNVHEHHCECRGLHEYRSTFP